MDVFGLFLFFPTPSKISVVLVSVVVDSLTSFLGALNFFLFVKLLVIVVLIDTLVVTERSIGFFSGTLKFAFAYLKNLVKPNDTSPNYI